MEHLEAALLEIEAVTVEVAEDTTQGLVPLSQSELSLVGGGQMLPAFV